MYLGVWLFGSIHRGSRDHHVSSPICDSVAGSLLVHGEGLANSKANIVASPLRAQSTRNVRSH